VLDRLVSDATAGRSRVLVLRGEAGIGKSALVEYLVWHAAGFRVARAVGVESEMEMAFAGLHQLCAPMLGRLDRLPAPQRDALCVAFGLSDGDNQFVCHRMTADHRILYGGWDAVFHRKGVDPTFDQRDASHQLLAERFFRTFPQLEGMRFTHRWGGAIDTCSRFAVFFNTTHCGKVAYAAGYTGLGVGASRFGARTALDLVDGEQTERTNLRLTRKRPIPFPPEPFRSAVIGLTQREIARADRNQGQRGLWLQTLDRLGLGFDS